jgi:hypothetical protein
VVCPARGNLLAIAALLLGGASCAAGAGARPDFAAAAAFGGKLQPDYAGKKSAALAGRFDSDAMMERVYARGIRDQPAFPAVKRQWETQTLPGIVRLLAGYDVFENLLVARVALLEGRRALECVLIRGDGAFQLATLFLTEAPPGDIRIADLHFASSQLEVTRAMRHTLLLMRVGLPGVLDDEEVRLARLGQTHGLTATLAVETLGQGKPDAAFAIWNGLPAELKATRIWIELRNRMAFNGSAAAMAQLQAEARAGGGGPPAVRFSLALAAKDHARALGALDEFIVAQRGLPFLRTVKADLLLNAGRADDALALARDIGTLAPAATGAHIVAFRAAAQLGRTTTATEALADWARVAPAAVIVKMVEADAAAPIAAFRATPEYAVWRRSAEAAPVSAPAKAP